jgi:hypothetical protein
MPDGEADETNFDRLQRHLKAESLAARLAAAYATAPAAGKADALSAITASRLIEITSGYDETK